jgi:hypothetical protein
MRFLRIPHALLAARRAVIEAKRRERVAEGQARREEAEPKAATVVTVRRHRTAAARRNRRAPEWDPIAFLLGLFLGSRF